MRGRDVHIRPYEIGQKCIAVVLVEIQTVPYILHVPGGDAELRHMLIDRRSWWWFIISFLSIKEDFMWCDFDLRM